MASGLQREGIGGGWRSGWRGKEYEVEQNGSPTHSWVGKHGLFGELEREMSASGQR